MVKFWRRLRGSTARLPTQTDSGLSAETLNSLDHGLGTLRVRGELHGYLASIVGEIVFPSPSPWPWFIVVRPNGRKEHPMEDYGPLWPIVRELEAGVFDHFGPSVKQEQRFFGLRTQTERPGPPCLYDFAWLPADEAAEKWRELGLKDSDF